MLNSSCFPGGSPCSTMSLRLSPCPAPAGAVSTSQSASFARQGIHPLCVGQRRAEMQLGSQWAMASSYAWSSSFSTSSNFCPPLVLDHNRQNQQQAGTIHAGWTRRSKSPLEPPKTKKSWKQRHEKFLKPFILDVFISQKYVHAKVVHRVTSRVVSVATTNAKDLRYSLYSLTDDNACKTIGKLLAERSIEADVFAVTFSLRKNERFEGKLALVVNTVIENGVALV